MTCLQASWPHSYVIAKIDHSKNLPARDIAERLGMQPSPQPLPPETLPC